MLHLVRGQVPDVDHFPAQIAHPLPLVEADVVLQDALWIVPLDFFGGDVFLALRTHDILGGDSIENILALVST